MDEGGKLMTDSPAVRIAWLAGVLSFGVLGAWAFVSPRSFFDAFVAFPPYNAHLLRDIGVFQLGIGAALVAAVWSRDATFVALAGAAVAGVLHVIAHIVDSDLGGRSTDVPLLAVLAVVLIAGRFCELRR